MRRRLRVLWIMGLVFIGLILFAHSHGAVATVMLYWPAIKLAAQENQIDPPLLAALVHTESSGDPDAGIPGGGVGLLQLMPAAAKDAAGGRAVSPAELRDPQTNLMLGAKYLAQLGLRFDDERVALAAFRLGPTRISGEIDKAGGLEPFLAKFSDHRAALYVAKVRTLKKLYQQKTAP